MKEKIKLTLDIIKIVESNIEYLWYVVNIKDEVIFSWSKKGMFFQISMKQCKPPQEVLTIHNAVSISLHTKSIEFYDINDKFLNNIDFDIDIEKIIKREITLNSLLS